MQQKRLKIGKQEIPIFDYDEMMGKYKISEDAANKIMQYPLKEQAFLFRMQVTEWDDYGEEEKFFPLYEQKFGGFSPPSRFKRIAFDNLGIVVDDGLIVGIKTEKRYLLLGQVYEDSYCPMFMEDYGGGQGDCNLYEINAQIVFDLSKVV